MSPIGMLDDCRAVLRACVCVGCGALLPEGMLFNGFVEPAASDAITGQLDPWALASLLRVVLFCTGHPALGMDPAIWYRTTVAMCEIHVAHIQFFKNPIHR